MHIRSRSCVAPRGALSESRNGLERATGGAMFMHALCVVACPMPSVFMVTCPCLCRGPGAPHCFVVCCAAPMLCEQCCTPASSSTFSLGPAGLSEGAAWGALLGTRGMGHGAWGRPPGHEGCEDCPGGRSLGRYKPSINLGRYKPPPQCKLAVPRLHMPCSAKAPHALASPEALLQPGH